MPQMNVMRKPATLLAAVLVLIGLGCARIPYTTTVVHEDQRLSVMLQREITPASYTHPVQITPNRWRQYSAAFRCASNSACRFGGMPKKLPRRRSSAKTNYRYWLRNLPMRCRRWGLRHESISNSSLPV